MRASAREHAPFSPGTSSCCVACGIIWRRLYGGEWEVEGDVPPEKNPEWVTKSKDGLNSDSELCADSRGSLLIPPSPLPPDWPFMFGFGFPDSFLASVSGLHLFRGYICFGVTSVSGFPLQLPPRACTYAVPLTSTCCCVPSWMLRDSSCSCSCSCRLQDDTYMSAWHLPACVCVCVCESACALPGPLFI